MKWYTYVLIIALVICATTARAETTTIRMFINDEPQPVVLMTEQLETVKVKIKNNSTGTEEEISTEEEPDCE